MLLLGDIGGFNSTIVLLPYLFMQIYGSRLFEWHVAKEILYKKKSTIDEPNNLQNKMAEYQH